MLRSAALSDATRARRSGAAWNVQTLDQRTCEKFHMTLTGMKKHVGVLAECKGKAERTLRCRPSSVASSARAGRPRSPLLSRVKRNDSLFRCQTG